MTAENWYETLCVGAALTVLLVYHLHLVRRVRRQPLATVVGRNRHARDAWVAKIVEHGADLLAVQSLRNWSMTATFLASTAILLGLGVLHFLFSAEQAAQLALLREGAATLVRAPGAFKLMILASLFLTAFFSFAQTLRLLNHLAFALAVTSSAEAPLVARQLHLASYCFTLGMRGYYLALPVALWLFGPLHFLVASVVLVALLQRLDYVRAGLATATP